VKAVRRAKPPPGIISAGGVDMARAHASNIQPAADTDYKPTETAKVVLAVETDPRRVRTAPRLDGVQLPPGAAIGAKGESPGPKSGGPEGADKRAPPSANLPVAAATSRERKDSTAGALWFRVAAAAVIVLLVAGVVRRVHIYMQRQATPAAVDTSGPLVPPPLPSEPTPATAGTTASAAPAAPNGTRALAPSLGATPSWAQTTTETSAAPPATRTPRVVRVRPAPPPPPPKATFTPLFELPSEKKN
jgi:hypothetical protein